MAGRTVDYRAADEHRKPPFSWASQGLGAGLCLLVVKAVSCLGAIPKSSALASGPSVLTVYDISLAPPRIACGSP